jgi:hypothetical protein
VAAACAHELAPRARGVGERLAAERADLGGGVGREVGGEVLGVEAREEPAEQAGQRRVVERGLRDAGHAHEVRAPARQARQPRHLAGERGDLAGHLAAVRLVAALAVERVVDLGRSGLRERGDTRERRRGGPRAQPRRGALQGASSVAAPSTRATVQWYVTAEAPAHQLMSLLRGAS